MSGGDRDAAIIPMKSMLDYRSEAMIRNVEMSESMQLAALECALQAFRRHHVEQDIAAHIRHEFDERYKPSWHCIVGRSFGGSFSHHSGHFIYFYMRKYAVLLFKSMQQT